MPGVSNKTVHKKNALSTSFQDPRYQISSKVRASCFVKKLGVLFLPQTAEKLAVVQNVCPVND